MAFAAWTCGKELTNYDGSRKDSETLRNGCYFESCNPLLNPSCSNDPGVQAKYFAGHNKSSSFGGCLPPPAPPPRGGVKQPPKRQIPFRVMDFKTSGISFADPPPSRTGLSPKRTEIYGAPYWTAGLDPTFKKGNENPLISWQCVRHMRMHGILVYAVIIPPAAGVAIVPVISNHSIVPFGFHWLAPARL